MACPLGFMGILLSLDTSCVSDTLTVPISGCLFPISTVTVTTFLLPNPVVVSTSQRCSSWTWKSPSAAGDTDVAFEVVALKFLLQQSISELPSMF